MGSHRPGECTSTWSVVPLSSPHAVIQRASLASWPGRPPVVAAPRRGRDLALLATALATALEGALLAARRLESALGGGQGTRPKRASCPSYTLATHAVDTTCLTARMPVRPTVLSPREQRC